MLFGAKENREANLGKHKWRHDPSCAGPGQPRAPFASNPKSSGKAPSRAGGLRGGTGRPGSPPRPAWQQKQPRRGWRESFRPRPQGLAQHTAV